MLALGWKRRSSPFEIHVLFVKITHVLTENLAIQNVLRIEKMVPKKHISEISIVTLTYFSLVTSNKKFLKPSESRAAFQL